MCDGKEQKERNEERKKDRKKDRKKERKKERKRERMEELKEKERRTKSRFSCSIFSNDRRSIGNSGAIFYIRIAKGFHL